MPGSGRSTASGFAIREGEAVSLAGENGSGKSTLIKILAGRRGAGCREHHRRGRELRAADAAAVGGGGDHGDLPGLLALPEPLGRREHRLQRRAARRAAAGRPAAGAGAGGADAGAGGRRDPARGAGRDAVGGAQAAGRDLPGARLGRAAHHHGRADHRADRARGAGAPRDHPPAEGGRRGGALRQPQARRGARGLRARRGAAQRPEGRRGAGGGVRRRLAHPAHDRARRGGDAAGAARRGRAAPARGARALQGRRLPRHRLRPARRRGARRLGPARLGAHGARQGALRPGGAGCRDRDDRRPRGAARRSARGGGGGHRLRARGPADRGAVPDPVDRAQRRHRADGGARARAAPRPARALGRGGGVAAAAGGQGAGPGRAGALALGRQPAAGGAGALAGARRRGCWC